MKRSGFLFILSIFLAVAGCSHDEYNDNVIVFALDSLLIDGEGEIRTLDFLSSGSVSCEVTSPDEWITLHADTLGRLVSYELVVSGNTTGAKRRGKLDIKKGGAAGADLVRPGLGR